MTAKKNMLMKYSHNKNISLIIKMLTLTSRTKWIRISSSESNWKWRRKIPLDLPKSNQIFKQQYMESFKFGLLNGDCVFIYTKWRAFFLLLDIDEVAFVALHYITFVTLVTLLTLSFVSLSPVKRDALWLIRNIKT